MNTELQPRKILPLALLGLAAFMAALAGGIYFYWLSLLQPVSVYQSALVQVHVPSGYSTAKVGGLLETRGVIRSGLALRLYARLAGTQGSIRAGDYLLSPSMGLPEILSKLTSGQVATETFTVPEGYTLTQITRLLADKGLIDEDKFKQVLMGQQFNYEFLRGLSPGENRLEGYLFPATYKVVQGASEKAIIDMMLKRFAREITPEFTSKARGLGLSVNQAVTLASIIEREAGRDTERATVASVFLNRLEKKMRLESCATVQYALGTNKPRLLYKDLQIDSPYNTYKILGLPPGPIASPGHASLQAAVNPASSDYLYFVVSRAGEHAFSKTLSEHNRKKKQYIARFQTP